MGTGRENEDEDGNEVEKEKEVVQVTVGNKGVGRGREKILLLSFPIFFMLSLRHFMVLFIFEYDFLPICLFSSSFNQ